MIVIKNVNPVLKLAQVGGNSLDCKTLVDDDDETCIVGNNTVCLECYEKYYSGDDEYNYDCGCSTQSTPYSYIMTKGIDMEATICKPCYNNRENNEFHNWNNN